MAIFKILQPRQKLPELHREPGKVERRHRQRFDGLLEERPHVVDEAFRNDPLAFAHKRIGLFGGDGADVFVEGIEAQPERFMALGEGVRDCLIEGRDCHRCLLSLSAMGRTGEGKAGWRGRGLVKLSPSPKVVWLGWMLLW